MVSDFNIDGWRGSKRRGDSKWLKTMSLVPLRGRLLVDDL